MNPALFILGDVMLDRYILGTVERISPEAPVPIVRVKQETINLGGAGNVAVNAAKLQAQTSLFGAIGDDLNGQILQAQAKEHNIDSLLFEVDMPTIAKIRVVGNSQQIVRYDFEKIVNSSLALEQLQQLLPYHAASHFIISDYGKGVCTEELCQHLITFNRKKGGTVIVDPKGLNWDKYRGAYLITPNLKELSEIWGAPLSNLEDEAITRAGEAIRRRFDIQHLLVTRSEKGMSLLSEAEVLHVPTLAQSVYDVTGAGDTVIATLGVSLAMGYSLKQAILRANYAAGIAVSKFGTYAVTREDLEPWDAKHLIDKI